MRTKKITAWILITILLMGFMPQGVLAADGSWWEGDYEINSTTIFRYRGSGGDLVLPQTEVIYREVFLNRDTIQSVVLPNNLMTIGTNAFSQCDNLKTIVVPDSTKYIQGNAFGQCTQLAHVVLGSSVEFLGTGAFQDCTSLKTVVFTGNLPPATIEYGLFHKVPTGLKVIVPYGKKDAYETVLSGHLPAGSEIVAPVSVTSLIVKSPPTKTNYMEGEALDLSGFVVTLNKSDGTAEDVSFANLGTEGITVNPMNGTILTANHTKVILTLTNSTKRAEQTIIVTKLDITADFTDANFLAAVRLQLGKGARDPIYDTDVSGISRLQVISKNISSLAGIQHFTGLTYLNCTMNQLNTLDVSGLTKLTYLYCSSNKLSTLDVSGLTSLLWLSCSSNQLTTLDMSGLIKLTGLECSDNQLTAMNVQGLTALTALNCSDNYMTSEENVTNLNKSITTSFTFEPQNTSGFKAVTNITGLTSVTTVGMPLALTGTVTPSDATNQTIIWSIDNANGTGASISGSTFIATAAGIAYIKATITKGATALTNYTQTFNITIKEVTGIDITADFTDANFLEAVRARLSKGASEPIYDTDVSGISSLDVSNKNISSLEGIQHFTGLTELNCQSNQLTTLDVSGLTKLMHLLCYENELTTLNVSGLTSLESLLCSDNYLTTLDVSGPTKLISLQCSINQLKTLDVSGLTNLVELNCSGNQLTTLDLSGLTKLTGLECFDNQLTTLDVSKLTGLMRLYCNSNQLTTLDVSGLANLTTLCCYENKLITLNLNGLTNLLGLDCNSNQLTTLDVSELTNLRGLECSVNQLTILDVSGLTNLNVLYCSMNQLNILNVNGLTNLVELYCYQNQLPAMNVQGLTALATLNCRYNYMTSEADIIGLDKVITTNFTFNPQNTSGFKAVTNITGLPSEASVGMLLTLTGTVIPSDSTNRTIVWRVQNAGTTGSTILGNMLSTTAAGTVTVTATIANGLTESTDYTQDFNITVNPAPVTVTSVTVNTAPTKITYTVGDILDLTGLVVTLHKSNSTTEDVVFADFGTKGITTTPTNGTGLSVSDTSVNITYTAESKSVSQNITVNPTPVTVTSVTVKTEPTKTTYTAGDSLDLTGLVVTLHKSDSSTEDVAFAEFATKGITTTPTNDTGLSVSDTSVNITYTADSKSVSQSITVTPAPVVDIDASISPTSVNYDLSSPADVVTTITWNSASTVSDVVYGTTSLTTPDVYVVSGSALTIKSSYINTLGISEGDEVKFKISFDKGNFVTLTVNIVDSYIPATNANLNGLTVDGSSVSGFDPNTTVYTVELPYGTASVSVGAIPNDAHATVAITQAQALPGDATVVVTAEDKTTTKSYTIHFTLESAPANNYSITVQSNSNGTVSANVYSASKGTEITLTATPNNGYRLKEWQVVDGGVTITDNKFTMPENNVTVKAIFEQIPATAYQVTINGSYAAASGAGSYSSGDIVTVNAGSRSNYTFSGWTSTDGITFANASSTTTTFIMPAGNVTITASWSYSGGSGGNSGGSGGNAGSTGSTTDDSDTTEVQPETKPDQPTIGSASVKAKKGTDNSATAEISEKTVANAIAKAQAEATEQEKTENGIGVSLSVSSPARTKSLGIVLTQPTLTQLTKAEVSQFEIDGSLGTLNFDLEAIKEIQKQSTGDVTINITPVAGLNGDAKTLVGTRPVYNISISYMKDGKTVNITTLGSGSVTLSIPYTPGKNEAVGYLFGVYVDGKGNATRIEGSTYDANSKSIIFNSDHFSVYGVGYTAPSEKFKDISSHWAKESIDYVVGRGLFSGTSATAFSPDAAMSRGMLVTALGRLAGVDVSDYKTVSFTDVAADKYYAPYIEWAYKNGIVSGIGNSQFAPDRAITREEIALILSNYAKATGYTLPVTREAAAFADADRIGSTYEDAVKAMQQAGIMMGGNGNKFNPKASATRAQISAMLHRYIKLTIDPTTAQGWAQNDVGQHLYYQDGKVIVGWQIIGSGRYFFDNAGVMQVGWRQDDNENWYYLAAGGTLVGWQNIGNGDSQKRYYFTTDGVMVSGKWLKINNKYYYFYKDGSLAVSTKIDGYKVDKNGVRKKK